MGLTREGFTADTYDQISSRIKNRLEAFSSGIDTSPESPDGQLVEIFSFELSQAWAELDLVYNSYNPNVAFGAGLRNIGLITGLPYGAATRSQTVCSLIGEAGTVVPQGSIVANGNSEEFSTQFAATIPASVQVVARVSGAASVGAGELTTIVSPVEGWTSVNNPSAGRVGSSAQTEVAFRNLRNRTVMRNFVAAEEVIASRIQETLGIEQVSVFNNDSPSPVGGVPANTISVTVGEYDTTVISDEDIAQVILTTKGLGCPTFGTTSVVINDTQGHPKTVYFNKATPKDVFMDIEILFLDADYAGAEESILADLTAHINSLATGEDVIWSRLFGIITPYSKAQVDKLEISLDGITYVTSNLDILDEEFATTNPGKINITVTNS